MRVTITGVETESGDDGGTTSYVIKAGYYWDNGCSRVDDNGVIYWDQALDDSGASLPCFIGNEDNENWFESWKIDVSDYSGYVCYGITFQSDGRVTFNLEDGGDLDAFSESDDGETCAVTVLTDITVTENQYKAWNAVFTLSE